MAVAGALNFLTGREAGKERYLRPLYAVVRCRCRCGIAFSASPVCGGLELRAPFVARERQASGGWGMWRRA